MWLTHNFCDRIFLLKKAHTDSTYDEKFALTIDTIDRTITIIKSKPERRLKLRKSAEAKRHRCISPPWTTGQQILHARDRSIISRVQGKNQIQNERNIQ